MPSRGARRRSSTAVQLTSRSRCRRPARPRGNDLCWRARSACTSGTRHRIRGDRPDHFSALGSDAAATVVVPPAASMTTERETSGPARSNRARARARLPLRDHAMLRRAASGSRGKICAADRPWRLAEHHPVPTKRKKRAEHRGTERSARQGKGRDWGAGRSAGVLPARRHNRTTRQKSLTRGHHRTRTDGGGAVALPRPERPRTTMSPAAMTTPANQRLPGNGPIADTTASPYRPVSRARAPTRCGRPVFPRRSRQLPRYRASRTGRGAE